MKKICILIYFIISITAVILLGYMTILAFVVPSVLHIKSESTSNSRISLLLATIFYAVLMIFLGMAFFKIQSEESLKNSFHTEFENRKKREKEEKIE